MKKMQTNHKHLQMKMQAKVKAKLNTQLNIMQTKVKANHKQVFAQIEYAAQSSADVKSPAQTQSSAAISSAS